MTDDDERIRGVLSPADRSYLQNPDEYSRQASHEREKKIRERVRNAILDFQVLSETMDEEDRRRVLELDEYWYQVDHALPYLIAFAHNVITDRYCNPRLERTAEGKGHKNRNFEMRLEDALYQAYLEHNVLVDSIELNVISKEVPGVSELRERIEEGHPVSTSMIQYLLTVGEIDDAELHEFLMDQLDIEQSGGGGGD